MRRLGLLDQMMFKMEEGGMPRMYMCGAMVLDPTDSPYPVDSQIIADHLAACMEEIPLMRQRLVQDPLKLGDLRLADDPDFDVHNHITRSTVAAPGGYKELTEALGKFSTRGMDLNRPLWQCEVMDGLENGHIAVATHIHHAILDAKGAQQVMGSLFGQEPVPGRTPRDKAWPAHPDPSPISLLGGALLENMERLYIRAPRFLLNNAVPMVKALSDELSKRLPIAEAPRVSPDQSPVRAHKTSLNVAPISTKRAVAYLQLPLGDIKAIRRRFGCSINDLALLLSSCALQHYFACIDEPIDFDLIAGMPIDLRAQDDTSVGNVLAFSRVNLHNTIDDIRERLGAIANDTAAIKQSTKPAPSRENDGAGVDFGALGSLFSPLVLDATIFGITRLNLMDKTTLVNVTVANVPGSQAPLYIAGARLHSQVPMGPCTDSLALNITVGSTNEHLAFGFHGCARTIRDKELLVEGVNLAFRALKRISQPRRRAAIGKAIAKSRPKTRSGAARSRRPKSGSRSRPKTPSGS